MIKAIHRRPDAGRTRRARVAIAEDDDDLRSVMADALGQNGFEVSFLPDGRALLEHLQQAHDERREPDLLILDERMPNMRGLEALSALCAAGSTVPVIMVTGYGADIRSRARALGARAVLDKPVRLDDLIRAVHRCTGTRTGDDPVVPHERTEPGCASCGSTEHVRLEERTAGVYFCADCWRRSEPPHPFDDLGGPG